MITSARAWMVAGRLTLSVLTLSGLTLPVLSGLVLAGCPAADASAQWVSVERGDLLIEVDVSGSLRATDSDSITPPTIGNFWEFKISMMAPEGAEVKKGEPILGFDPTELRRRLDKKRAQRDSAATQVEQSRSQAQVLRYDDDLSLVEARAQARKAARKADTPEHIVARHELRKAQMELELAEDQVAHLREKSRDARARSRAEVARWDHERARAQAKLEQLTAAIETLTVPAPRDGTVVYESDWRGKKPTVGDSVWRVGTVMHVVSLDSMEAIGEVDEVDSSQVKVGQSVSLHLDAQPDVALRGKIAAVSPTVRRQSPENPLKVAELRIELEPADELRLRPGMRFRGKVLTRRIEDALIVPIEAIVPTAEGPRARVRRGRRVELVPVEVGARDADSVQILAGLELGDQLLREEPRP